MNAAYPVNEPTTLCWIYIHTLTVDFVEGKFSFSRYEKHSMRIQIQQMQKYADIYSLQNYSTCFGCHSSHHQEY